MKKHLKKLVMDFKKNIDVCESKGLSIEENLENIKKEIQEETNAYYQINDDETKIKIKEDLVRNYNLLHYYRASLNGIRYAFLQEDDLKGLKEVYVLDEKPLKHEVNSTLLENINSASLTKEEANELLKWTVNNTRENLEKVNQYEKYDVYGNASLIGCCGFSQFSSLYPLEKLGFKITINNVGSFSPLRHAFGTVTLPINENGKIINKSYIIDCTYRQFFTLPFNVVTRYFSGTPHPGFFIDANEDEIKFAKELLENGFVEATKENIEKYCKPFFATNFKMKDVKNIDKEFSKLDILNILENKTEKFDYDEEEFANGGYNLSIVKNSKLL